MLPFHFEYLMMGQPPPGRDVLLDVFQAAWSERADREIVLPAGETFDSLCRLADRMLLAFQQTDFASPRGHIIGIEEELRGVLVPGLPDLLARVDLIVATDEGLVVSDLKTAARAWGQAKVDDAGPQLLLYGELARELAEGKPIRLQFALFTKTKRPSLELRPVRFDAGSVERTKALVTKIWKAIQSGNFYPSPSPLQCPTCPFRQPCAAWRG